MQDPDDDNNNPAEDAKTRKAKADKAAAEAAAAEPQLPVPGQEEADAIKERVAGDETRDVQAKAPKASYKTR